MYKKILNALLFILILPASHYALAHGSGGGSSDFGKRDYAAERAADKKAAELKNDQDDWADFMKAVDKPKQKNGESSTEDHGHHQKR